MLFNDLDADLVAAGGMFDRPSTLIFIQTFGLINRMLVRFDIVKGSLTCSRFIRVSLNCQEGRYCQEEVH